MDLREKVIHNAPFAVRIVQRKDGKAAILYRRKTNGDGKDRFRRVGSLSPIAFMAAQPLIKEAISQFNWPPEYASQLDYAKHTKNEILSLGGYKPLDADWGAKVTCFALISSHLQDPERLARSAEMLRHADPTEAAWWFGMLTRKENSRAIRALRILTEAVA